MLDLLACHVLRTLFERIDLKLFGPSPVGSDRVCLSHIPHHSFYLSGSTRLQHAQSQVESVMSAVTGKLLLDAFQLQELHATAVP